MSRVIGGGKAIYGPALGFITLDTQFPRVIGDAGNADTWNFPVHYKVLDEIRPADIFKMKHGEILDLLISAGRELISRGAEGIVLNIDYMSQYQKELSSALAAPIASSPLLQIPSIESMLPKEKHAGIITMVGNNLTTKHFTAIKVRKNVPISEVGADSNFSRTFALNQLTLDWTNAQEEMLDTARMLFAENPNLGAIVLEGVSMAPYANTIRSEMGLPIFSAVSLVNWFHGSIQPAYWMNNRTV